MPSVPETFSLQNTSGLKLEVISFGAGIRSLSVPLPDGPVETVLSYPASTDYLNDPWYLGKTIGRCAGRLDGARVSIDGSDHALVATPGQHGHCLHGGAVGFSHQTWEVNGLATTNEICFRLVSINGDQGFPGQVEAKVTYTLLEGWGLRIHYQATTDAPTVVNLTNHAYFNLGGDSGTVDDHYVSVNADHYTPLEPNLIPTGVLDPVNGSPFDLRHPARLETLLEGHHPQLTLCNGFDHNFVLNGIQGKMRMAASLYSPVTGLQLNVHSNQSGMQLYTGQYLDTPFRPRQGLCFESQNYPNAANTSGFPDAVLRPGECYEHVQVLSFLLPERVYGQKPIN